METQLSNFGYTVPASPEAARLAQAADSVIAQIRTTIDRGRQIASASWGSPQAVRDNVIGSLNTLERTLDARIAGVSRDDLVEGRLDPSKYFAAAGEIMNGVGRQLEVLSDFSYWATAKASFEQTLKDVGDLAKKAAFNAGPWIAGAAVLAFVLYFVVPKVLRQRSMAGARRSKQPCELDEGDEEDDIEEDEEEIEETEMDDRPFHVKLVKGRRLASFSGLRGVESKGRGLWAYNHITGLWKLERKCTPDTEQKWLEIFQRDEPDTAFKLSKNRPSGKPKGFVPPRVKR